MREGDSCPRCGVSVQEQDKNFHCTLYFFKMTCRSCRYEWTYVFPEPKATDISQR